MSLFLDSPPTSPTSATSSPTTTVPDWSQPLAPLLHEATHEAHDTVVQSPAAKALLSGTLSKEEAFERGLDRHSTHPVLEPTYNPTLLARTSAPALDISHLLQTPSTSRKSHPIYKSITSSPPSGLVSYIGRLAELSSSQDPTGLLAHAYVRYLGNLSCGQTIRHMIAKAYGLDEQERLGLEFYRFNEKMAGQCEMKQIKEWFRQGMNVVGEKNQVKEIVLAESKQAFELTAELFACIECQESTTDVTDDADEQVESKGPVMVAEYEAPETTYLSSLVIATVAAAGIAHFLLVVGGFTGSTGYQKLIAFEEWFDHIWKTGSA